MRNELQESQPVVHSRYVDRIVRMDEATWIVGLSRSSIYNRTNSKSKYFDKTFPQPLQLGFGSIGWRESDLLAWLTTRP